MHEGLVFAGGLVAAPLALSWGSHARRAALALLALGLLLVGALPAEINATFPSVEIGRARPPLLEDGLILALACGVIATTRAAGTWLGRAAAWGAAVVLWANLLVPVKSTLQVIEAPEAGMTTVPVLAWEEPVPARWTRRNADGTAVSLFMDTLSHEWTVMEIAGGIHEEAGRLDEGPWAGLRHLVRYGSWRVLEAAVAVAAGLRVLAAPAALVVLAGPSFAGATGWRVVRAGLRSALWLLPLANLGALVVGALVWLPDDAELRFSALFASVLLLSALRLVDPGEDT
jgi:hypothetical protein